MSDIKSVSLPGPFCRMRLRRLARWLPIILFVCYAVFNGGWILRWNGHSGCGQWRLLGDDEVGISPDLSKRIDVWLEQYWKEFIKGFPDRDKIVELDDEGIRIAHRLKKEFPEDKIGYFSDARMVALYDEKVHGGFRSGNDCRSKGKNEDG